MDTLIEIGIAVIDFVVGVVEACSGNEFKRKKKRDTKSN